MHPLLKELQRDNDPHDALEIPPDVVFAARADRPSPTLAPGAMGHASDPQRQIGSGAPAGVAAPSLDTTIRDAAADNNHVLRDRSSFATWAMRGLVGILLAVAAAAWQHYGDRASAVIANWTPRFALTSSAPANPPEPASPPALQAAVATEAPEAPAAPAQAAPPEQAPDTGAPPSAADQTQLIQSMARDVATMGQQIEQLKASIDQLRASQEQMSRDVMAKTAEAKASEPALRPRPAPPPPRPAAAPVRKPRPAFSAAQPAAPLPPQAAPPAVALPPEPPQATAAPDGEPVVRPPMPVR
jgi:hypothetical protein